MYDDVLFPTDGSDATHRALRHALDIAGRYDATLHALSVLTDEPYRAGEGRITARETAERTVEAVRERARRNDVDAVAEVREGAPNEEILAYAEDRGIDMIVMGTHGRTGIGRALLGSVTERVVRAADAPVVTVRALDDPAITSADEATDIALDELRERGYREVTIAEEPYRTTGSWIVPVSGDDRFLHVHVDARSGNAHVARLDDS